MLRENRAGLQVKADMTRFKCGSRASLQPYRIQRQYTSGTSWKSLSLPLKIADVVGELGIKKILLRFALL